MTTLIGHMSGFTRLLGGATAPEDGSWLNLKGAIRSILLVQFDEDFGNPTPTWDDATPAVEDGSAIGALIFEVSYDDGVNWQTATAVRRLEDDDSAEAFSTLDGQDFPVLLKVDHFGGSVLFRARITSEFDEPISVLGIAIGR